MSLNTGQIPLKVGRTEFAHLGGQEDWIVFCTLPSSSAGNPSHSTACYVKQGNITLKGSELAEDILVQYTHAQVSLPFDWATFQCVCPPAPLSSSNSKHYTTIILEMQDMVVSAMISVSFNDFMGTWIAGGGDLPSTSRFNLVYLL